jgi:uncharacterized protein
MIKIYVKGLKDGLYEVELSEPVKAVPDLSDEFFGNIEVTGKLRVIGNRFNFSGKAVCSAKLVCDRTLKEFVQSIEAEFTVAYIVDTTGSAADIADKHEKERILSKEDKYIDITDDVREELILNIPMKKIAPDVNDMEFDDIYPEYSAKKNKKIDDDDRWSALKNIKIN